MKKFVFLFDEIKKANSNEMLFLLGNKGAQLAEMTASRLPVPPGFVISTEACREFYASGRKLPFGLEKQVKLAIKKLEIKTKKFFGSPQNPLLVSVRSGSYVSMPGMMETILNLGLNDKTVEGLAEKTKNRRMAFDSYRRFIAMFGDVVLGVKHADFEKILENAKETKGVKLDTELDASDLEALIPKYKLLVRETTGKDFPDNAWVQLVMAIGAVFGSWNGARAIAYRNINHLRHDAGTAVNVQSMVFGNMGESSGTGVAFTRNPATGKKEHYGEFLVNAQGEDVVAGTRTPMPIDEMKKLWPRVYNELLGIYSRLEEHYRDMQDFEFTIENGKFFLLQTRSGKRAVHAAVKIAVEMHKEGLISKEEAVLGVKPEQLDKLLHKQLDPIATKEKRAIAKGINASPGAAVGKAVFSAEKAKELFEKNPSEKLVLVRLETSPEDIEGMNVAQGILTARGGATSHAAVVARGMGKPCVSGADINVSEEKKQLATNSGIAVNEGDWLSLDGGTGEVFEDQIPLVEPAVHGDFAILMDWADSFRKLKIKANADTPKDAQIAKNFGAEGIGLCRTEHMFFEGERIKSMRKMIVAEFLPEREKALEELLPYQKEDFKGLFKAMDGLPVIIRFLDPPLHEFLPKENKEIIELAQELGISEQKLRSIISSLQEFNPMLGFRGCRLGIQYPEIASMQAKAVFLAALEAQKEGLNPIPWIEIPIVGALKEFLLMKSLVEKEAQALGAKGKLDYKIGTMIEVPRACMIAGQLAKQADFFSFGTNDLTQMSCGLSRDDSAKFLKKYVEQGIFEKDPFQSIDIEGVGSFMKMAIEKARSVKPKLEIGICGEHGGDPASIEFCHKIGLNDVSCSPYRVPIARLAAAQAAVKEKAQAKKEKPKTLI